MTHDLFISYTQPDREVAHYMHDVLQEHGLRCWMAPSLRNGIRTGVAFESQIVDAVKASRVFILIYSDYCNHSDDIIREVRQRNKGHKTIIVRCDRSKYRSDLSYYLDGVQYIEALGGSDLHGAALTLVQDVCSLLEQHTDIEDGPTDEILLRRGKKLLDERKYDDAAAKLRQYRTIAPGNNECRFCLALALVAGQRIMKLRGSLVRDLESILEPAVPDEDAGAARALLAAIKYGYYQQNGFKVAAPSVESLTAPSILTPTDADVLFAHLHPADAAHWRHLSIPASHKQH